MLSTVIPYRFQTLKGSLQTNSASSIPTFRSGFKPSKDRYKLMTNTLVDGRSWRFKPSKDRYKRFTGVQKMGSRKWGFKPSKDRYKLIAGTQITNLTLSFQTLKGSLQTGQVSACFSPSSRFQTLKGSLQTMDSTMSSNAMSRFQTLKGSLQTFKAMFIIFPVKYCFKPSKDRYKPHHRLFPSPGVTVSNPQRIATNILERQIAERFSCVSNPQRIATNTPQVWT